MDDRPPDLKKVPPRPEPVNEPPRLVHKDLLAALHAQLTLLAVRLDQPPTDVARLARPVRRRLALPLLVKVGESKIDKFCKDLGRVAPVATAVLENENFVSLVD